MSRTFGPRMDGGRIHFSLWAPDAPQVWLERPGCDPDAMHDCGDGWKEIAVQGAVGQRYRFRIGDLAFPDPASRRQAGGIHGWSVVTPTIRADGWKGRPWHETILYECHAGLMGGFAGVAARLPELADTGFTAIELMPVAAFPGAHNWGYDGVLPFAVAESYGSVEDLRALLARAHGLGISVLLDVVYNHFGPDGNYLPLYAKSFFRQDRHTPWGPAIDFRVSEVRGFFADNARYWLFDIGFDGLRFDAVHAMIDDGWLDSLAADLRAGAGGRHIHLVLENEDNGARHLHQGFDAQWNDDIHHALHVLLIGETRAYYQDYAGDPAALLARGLADGFIYQGEPSRNRKGAPRGEPSTGLPPTAFINFLQNHDQTGNRAFGERLTVLADPAALKAAVALLLLSPQIPMVFMGEEWGSRAPFLFFTDHEPGLAQLVREGRRREFAAFADMAHGREIPDPNSLSSFMDSDPARDAPRRAQWLSLYRHLLSLRKQFVIPGLAQAQTLGAWAAGDKAVVVRWRMGSQTLTLASNLGHQAVTTDLPEDTPFHGKASGKTLPAVTTLAWLTA